MKTTLGVWLAAFVVVTHGVTQGASADDSFTVYAPSRDTGELLVVGAESAQDGLKLRLARRVELGFPAATIAAHPDKPLVYVAAAGGKEGDTPGAVVALGKPIDNLKPVPVTLRHGYSYLSLDRAGRFLLGANYGGGQVDVYQLDEKGLPGKAVAALDEGRPNAHCVVPSPDNRFVYIPYVKQTNAIFQYRFDPDSGLLTPLDPKDAGPPEGTGPRHMAYHPSQPIVYFSNEQHLGVSVYQKQPSGQLELRQVCDAVDSDESQDGVSSSDIVITPGGRFLFAGIRGHSRKFDWISRYRIQESGEVELLGLTAADKIPWGLALSPSGSHLLVTAFEGATLTAFKISDDGDLKAVASLPWDKHITDLVTR